MIKDTRAYQYAKWAVKQRNKKVGRYIKKQAKAWLRIADGKHKTATVNEKAVRKVEGLLRLMVHPDLMCPMYDGLEDYAWFLILAVFCTVRRDDGRRFYTTAVLEIFQEFQNVQFWRYLYHWNADGAAILPVLFCCARLQIVVRVAAGGAENHQG